MTSNFATDVEATWGYDLADRLTGAVLGNGAASAFAWDNDGRVNGVRHASSLAALQETIADLCDVGYGYDRAGNRQWSHNRLVPDRSEVYTHDRLDRLTRMDRGVLDTGVNPPVISSPLQNSVLPSGHRWMGSSPALDHRGNWAWNRRWFNGSAGPMERRFANERNEYTTSDLDAAINPPDPVPFDYDTNPGAPGPTATRWWTAQLRMPAPPHRPGSVTNTTWPTG